MPYDPWRRIARGGADQCWPWLGTIEKDGYGVFKTCGRQWRAPRWVLQQKLGRDLAPGEVTRHACDNRACCNPDHLLVGTPADNTRDMRERGRHLHGDRHWTRQQPERVRGERNPASRLTASDVLVIRQSYAAGARQVALAAQFGVSQPLISAVVRRAVWDHLEAA